MKWNKTEKTELLFNPVKKKRKKKILNIFSHTLMWDTSNSPKSICAFSQFGRIRTKLIIASDYKDLSTPR